MRFTDQQYFLMRPPRMMTFVFSATNNLCVIVRLKDAKLYKCRYEQGGETVDAPCGMTQGFDKMFIFRTTKTTLIGKSCS